MDWIILVDVIAFLLIGVFAGTMAGLFGLGGGVVIVPTLAYIFMHSTYIPFEHSMHLAVGTSLATMVFTVQASVRAHYRYGRILWPVYKAMAPWLLLGAMVGVLVADALNTTILRALFGVLLFFVAIKLFYSSHQKAKLKLPSKTLFASTGSGVGVLAGMLGIGGGVLIIPFLAAHHIRMRNIIGVSAVCSLTVATVGSVVSIYTGLHETGLPAWSTGFIYWPAVLVIAFSSSIITPLAASYAYKLPVDVLRKLFALIMLLIGLHMLIS